MLIIKVYGATKETRKYTPTTFIFTESETVYADNKEIGFLKHPKTKKEISDHIINLILEGFTTENITTKELKAHYSKLIQGVKKYVRI